MWADGRVFDWGSGRWVAVPDLAVPATRAMAAAGLPVDLIAWVLEPWEWTMLVCLLAPEPELAAVLPQPIYSDERGLILAGCRDRWLPLAIALVAALRAP